MAFPPAYNHPYHQQHQQHQVPHFSTAFAPHEPHFPQQPAAPLGASPPGQMDTSTSYLPAYLLGGSPASRSPTRQRHSPYYPRGQHTHRTSDINMTRGVSVRASPYSTEGSVRKLDKPVGPPIQSLYDHTSSPVQSSTPLVLRRSPERRHLNFSGMTTVNKFSGTTPDMHRMTPSRGTDQHHTTLSTPPYSAVGNSQISPPSPPQLDPFYSQGETISSDDRLDECWITIFGFPSSASAYLLDQFSQYGTILKHEVVAEGNWMHIQYQTRLQAKKALSKNGKVFGSGVMVGVQQCVDKAVMSVGGAAATATSPVTHVLPKQTTIRPLTAAYQAASSGHELAPSNPNTPQKSTGFLSRAMEYMFGW